MNEDRSHICHLFVLLYRTNKTTTQGRITTFIIYPPLHIERVRASISKSRISVPKRIAVSVKSADAKSCRLSSLMSLFFRFTIFSVCRPKYLYFSVPTHVHPDAREPVLQSNFETGARWCISRGKTDAITVANVWNRSTQSESPSRFALVNSRCGTLLDSSMSAVILVRINLLRLHGDKRCVLPNDSHCR